MNPMTIAWITALAVSAGALAWHELHAHHRAAGLFRIPAAPSAHHDMWAGLAPARRSEIQAEMLLVGVLYAAVAGLYPGCALVMAAVSAACAAWMLLAGWRS